MIIDPIAIVLLASTHERVCFLLVYQDIENERARMQRREEREAARQALREAGQSVPDEEEDEDEVSAAPVVMTILLPYFTVIAGHGGRFGARNHPQAF